MSILEIFSKELNPPQCEAVTAIHGPLLILAGAGSGKTRVLTYRIANIVAQGEATPQEIFAVTFTNKAARGMEQRALELLLRFEIPVYDRLWISTFHSSCARILREHIHHLGYQPFFVIYDTSDQLSVVKKVCDHLQLNEKIYAPKSIQAFINNSKMLAKSPESLQKQSLSFFEEKANLVYAQYEIEMKRSNALDFGDLLLKTLDLFRNHPTVLDHYQNLFKFVMVDEYQDTNHIQYLLVHLISQHHRNLCVVGDEDQSIYSWRGADIRNILDFEKDFQDAKIVKLEENYRSSQTIVKAASAVVKNNSQRKDKTLYTNNPTGDLIVLREENNEYDEARFVASSVKQLNMNGANYPEIAVFYRTNAQSRVLEEQLRQHSIPYRIVGGVKFYDRMEVKDILAYMKILLNPSDDVAVQRVINVPARGIGKTTIDKLQSLALQMKCSMIEAAKTVSNNKDFNAGARRKLDDFLKVVDEIQKPKNQTLGPNKPSELYHHILSATKYIEFLKEQDSSEAESRIENLEELDNAIRQFEKERGDEASVQSFLEEIALVSEIDSLADGENTVTLMTLHISKGLEFPYVFIVGMEDGLFPSLRGSAPLDSDDLEEERRLAYVGMTRAEKKLFLSYARTRKVWGQDQFNPPSRFLKEIPPEYLEQSQPFSRPSFLQKYRQQWNSQADQFPDYENKRGEERDIRRDNFESDQFFDPPSVQTSIQDGDSLAKGSRVRHPTFGVGTIFKCEGTGENQKVSVLFSDNTLKKFVVKYARLERV